jgi:hypothetical protein
MVKLTCLASCTVAGLLLFVTEPALAEFQIQEAGIEKGEVELEYRGAYHWGVPQVTGTNENANDLVQSVLLGKVRTALESQSSFTQRRSR